jgi:hypothetical protein
MTAFQNRLSFVMMAALIFLGEDLVLWGWVSTGPHVYLDLAFGWLQLHRYGDIWAIEHFDFRMLIVAVLSSVLLTWVFSRALRRTQQFAGPGRHRPLSI